MAIDLLKTFLNGDYLTDSELLTLRHSLKMVTEGMSVFERTTDFELKLIVLGSRQQLNYVEDRLTARGVEYK